MNDPSKPFMESVEVTKPYLAVRSVSGVLILIGHMFFITIFYLMLRRKGLPRTSPPWVSRDEVSKP